VLAIARHPEKVGAREHLIVYAAFIAPEPQFSRLNRTYN
jgi:hypothetical protein